MFLWRLLTPSLVLTKSICGITPRLMEQYGLKGLILDVDDTIVGSADIEVSEAVCEWVNSLKPLYPIWLVSNNFNQQRIQAIGDQLGLPYRSRASKPSLRVIRQVLAEMNLPPAQVAMVGDRLLTDIVAGNRAGMFSILIQPVASAPPANLCAFLRVHTGLVRNWEIWLARKSGIKI